MAHSKECSTISLCTLCQDEETENVAVIWCTNCQTFLCFNCNKVHEKIRSSKDHTTMSVENFQELPSCITKIDNQCKVHRREIEVYCFAHKVSCCLECALEDHKLCQDVKNITEVLRGFKTSSSVFHIERDLSVLLENFDIMEKYLTTRIAAVDTQKTNIEQEIRTKKEELINHLNTIEKRSIDDLNTQHAKVRSKIEKLYEEIKKKKSQIHFSQTDFEKMKEFATELKMFEGIKEIEKMTTEQTQYIGDCSTKGLLGETNLKVRLAPLVKSLLTELETFATIYVSVNDSSLQLKQGERSQVSTESFIKPTIDKINPKIKKIIDLPKNQSICGCQILPDERMVFVNYSKKTLMLYSKEGNYVRDLVTFPKSPYDVTHIKDNVVAVTSRNDVEVYFVDVDGNKIMKTINVKQSIYRIDIEGLTIRLTTGISKTIINLNLDGEILSHQSIKSKALYTAIFEDSIYVSEYWDNKISCYEKKGHLLWTFSLDEIRSPSGISVDKHGFVYVSCFNSNNLIVVSPDGKQSKVILNNNDGIHNPVGLSMDRKSSCVLVANNDNGKGFLFKLY